jgi:hypothetical protein
MLAFIQYITKILESPNSYTRKQRFSNWRTAARFHLLKLVFVHMAEYITYYAYTVARYLSTPNRVSPGFDAETPSILPDMDGEAGTFSENCYWSETFCLK